MEGEAGGQGGDSLPEELRAGGQRRRRTKRRRLRIQWTSCGGFPERRSGLDRENGGGYNLL